MLSLELFKSIVEQGKSIGLTGVKLTGGEPLLHPDIGEILEYIKGEDLVLTIETNGVLCTSEIAQQIRDCKDPFVSVSLDGAVAETHEWVRGIRGCFDAALKGIRNLVNAKIKPQIIMSIMRQTKDEMDGVVRLAESLEVESVKFNITMPMARGEKLHQTGETLTLEELVRLGDWVENSLSDSTHLRLDYDHPSAFRPLGKMFGDQGTGCGCCRILNIIGVLSNGCFALCGIGMSVPELIFGNAATDRLEQVWESAEVLNELREGLTERLEGICGDCLMNSFCMGSCIAHNYYKSKNLWSPFWFCEEAEKAGLFPVSRKRPV